MTHPCLIHCGDQHASISHGCNSFFTKFFPSHFLGEQSPSINTSDMLYTVLLLKPLSYV